MVRRRAAPLIMPFSSVFLFLLHASAVFPLVFELEENYPALALVRQHQCTSFLLLSSPLCSSTNFPAWRSMSLGRYYADSCANAVTAPMIVVHAPAFCGAVRRVERRMTTHSPAPLVQLVAARTAISNAGTNAAGGISRPLVFVSGAALPSDVCPSKVRAKALGGGRQRECEGGTLSAAASQATHAGNTAVNAVAADLALNAGACGDIERAAQTAPHVKFEFGWAASSIATSPTTCLPSGKQSAQTPQRGAAGANKHTPEEKNVPPQFSGNDRASGAAADAVEGRHRLFPTCGVPVGSIAAFQYVDRDVDSSSTSHPGGQEKQDAQQHKMHQVKGFQEKQHSRMKAEKREGQHSRSRQNRERIVLELDCRHQDWAQPSNGQLQQHQQKNQRPRRRVIVLGSTGSIGRSTLQVVEDFPDRFEIVGLAAAGTNLPLLLQQIQRHRPRYVAVGSAATAAALKKLLLSPASVLPDVSAACALSPAPSDVHSAVQPSAAVAAAGSSAAALPSTLDAATSISSLPFPCQPPAASAAKSSAINFEHLMPQILYGKDGLVSLAALDGYDVLVCAVVGFTGLEPTLEALTTGKDVALANKEALVAAGEIFRSLYRMPFQPVARGLLRKSCKPKRERGHTRSSTSENASSGNSAMGAAEGSAVTQSPSPSPLYPSSFVGVAKDQRHKPLGLLLPVDSEHSGIFQALQGVAPTNYPPRKLLLVATGGPFRGRTKADLQHVTLDQVLKHPCWSMGAKISVDSATMMNKGLEVIEAHYAFGCPYSAVEVLVHPQAVVHSAVELCDGAILAQLGAADMKLPIAYALTWPERLSTSWPRVDLLKEGVLTFEKPDCDTFGCLRLAYEAGIQGGLAPACLNAANEVAVKRLLEKRLSFLQIEQLVRHVLRELDRQDGNRAPSDSFNLQIWGER